MDKLTRRGFGVALLGAVAFAVALAVLGIYSSRPDWFGVLMLAVVLFGLLAVPVGLVMAGVGLLRSRS